MDKYNSKGWKIIRWVGVLPSAFIGMYAIPIIVYLFFHVSFDMASDSYLLGIVTAFSSGVAAIILGVEVAPNNKKVVAFILLILVVLLCGATFYIILKQAKYVFDTIKLCSSLAGSIIAYFLEILFRNSKFEYEKR